MGPVGPAWSANTVGVTLDVPAQSFGGFTLFTPGTSPHAYLVNHRGELVRRWTSAYPPGVACYLLENGNLFRCARSDAPGFNAGGRGGRLEEFNWDGDLLWAYEYADDLRRHHHDAIKLPNGNVLVLAWELKTREECLAAGRDPDLLGAGGLWPEHLVEIQPFGDSGGTIVWEWHAWDHLIQDFDSTKENYGAVGDHPELVDLNFSSNPSADFMHMNGLDYHADLDQILLSVHGYSEIWIIDHSTTTQEAAGHAGGRGGRGGDLLYRWGNPQVYRAGEAADQRLFRQHNPNWIRDPLPGAGNILIFNNGPGRPGGNYSTVDEIIPPVDESGGYSLAVGEAYGPASAAWAYAANPASSFYAQNVSGAQRLPNGNTMICDGPHGTFFEVTPAGEVVWRYVCPVTNGGLLTQGEIPPNINLIFRAPRYAADYPGLAQRNLTSHGTIEIPANQGFRLTEPVPSSTSVHLQWTSLPDRAYAVEWLPWFGGGDWSEIGAVQSIGTLSRFIHEATVGEAVGQGYYRIRQIP